MGILIDGHFYPTALFKTFSFIYKVHCPPLAIAFLWRQQLFILQYLQYEVGRSRKFMLPKENYTGDSPKS